MPFFSLNSSEGSGILRTLSESSIPPVSVVDVSSVSSDSGILMDESVVGDLGNYDSDDDVRSIGSGLPMDESVVGDLEDYDYDNDTLPEVIDHDFVDLLELYDQQEAIIRPPLVQRNKRSSR